ncbi:MAG: acetate--CoA ligase family protein [Opitutae bacterium]|nr:acetate--CoA ligase family protein [Opitutae bacterium]
MNRAPQNPAPPAASVGRVVPDEPSSAAAATHGSSGRLALPSAFVCESAAYELLTRAGLHPPRHAALDSVGQRACARLFAPGDPIVLKGLGDELWHKSELGCVRFLPFDSARLTSEAAAMRARVETHGHAWIAALACERIAIQRQRDLPSEAFVSLSRTDAGWVVLCGFGGLQANALAELAPPCRWPIDVVTPEQALTDFSAHLLGRAWLGDLRDTHPLTTGEDLRAFFASLWQLAALAEAEGLALLELNPVALDPTGTPRPLDAVGQRACARSPERHAPPADFLAALRTPRRIALAGVSAQEGGVGRTILDNLRRYALPPGDLILVKKLAPDDGGRRSIAAETRWPATSGRGSEQDRPSSAITRPRRGRATEDETLTRSATPQTEFLGLPCIPDVAPLRDAPVDLLILALPAPAAAATLEALIAQGEGASCVALVAGGIGDGADTTGLGARLSTLLRETRAAGRWTPAVLGPNFLGHWSPALDLDSSFIPTEKLAAPARTGGELTLLSQSGAFLLCRRSRQPQLRFGLGIALGNQMDVAMCDVLAALASEEHPGPVACYVEGFGPGQLAPFAQAARELASRGARVLLHRAGRTEAGQAAAASHTGAMAGDLALERELLERSGVRFTGSIAEFDAALAWLGAYPRLTKGPVALLTNAGFESVNGSDLFGRDLPAATLDANATATLAAALAAKNLGGLVSPRLPLDLPPMADESAFLSTAEILLRESAVLVVGLVPFTRQLATAPDPAREFARRLAALARNAGKPLAVAVDAGPAYEEYRAAFAAEGVPTFDRVENALLGLRVL